MSEQIPLDFDGKTYNRKLDGARLGAQLLAVRMLMLDGKWRTLKQISEELGRPQASVSARLRDLRKPKFGSFNVERRARGDRKSGLYEYRVMKS